MSITVIPDPSDNYAQNFMAGANLTLQHQESQMRQKAGATEIALKQMQMQHEEQSLPLRLQSMKGAIDLTAMQLASAQQAMSHADLKLGPQLEAIQEGIRASRASTELSNRQIDLEGRRVASGEKATDASIRQGDRRALLEERQMGLLEQQASIDQMYKTATLGLETDKANQAKQFFDLQALGVVTGYVEKATPEMLKMYASMESDVPALKQLSKLATAKMKGDDFLMSEQVMQTVKGNPELYAQVVTSKVSEYMSGMTQKDQLVASLGLLNAPTDIDGNMILPPEVAHAFRLFKPEVLNEIKEYVKERQTNPDGKKGVKTPVGRDLSKALEAEGAPKPQTVEELRNSYITPHAALKAYAEADKVQHLSPTAARFSSITKKGQAEREIDLLHPQGAQSADMWQKRGFTENEAKQKADAFLLDVKQSNPGKMKTFADDILKDPQRKWAASKDATIEQKGLYNTIVRNALLEPNKKNFIASLTGINLRSKLPPADYAKVLDLIDTLSD